MTFFRKIKYIIRGKTYYYEQIVLKIDEIVTYAINLTKNEVINWINKYVPKRTGQLREDLIKQIDNNWIYDKLWMDLNIQTEIEYAINIIGNAAHHGTWFEHSGKPAVAFYANWSGNIYLDDPEAISAWYAYIGEFINDRWYTNLEISINKILGLG